MTGTGALAGFNREILLRVGSEVHTGPRNPGDPIQDFDTEMVGLAGQIFGDPDFDLLQVRAGREHGLPASMGRTVLTLGPGGNWNVDSFFDISYAIEFQGAPGSLLEGLSGSTSGALRMQAGVESGGCAPLGPGIDVFPSTAQLVLEVFDRDAEPFIVRLSSADLPMTEVTRGH